MKLSSAINEHPLASFRTYILFFFFKCLFSEDKPAVSGTISVVGGAAKDELDQEKEKGERMSVFCHVTGHYIIDVHA